jgi:hypothetical protein
MNMRSRCLDGVSGRSGSGQAEHLMTRVDELRNDG